MCQNPSLFHLPGKRHEKRKTKTIEKTMTLVTMKHNTAESWASKQAVVT